MSSSILMGSACVLAFVAAGACHSFWLGSRLFRRFAVPLDGGLALRGRPILGRNKTVAGFLVMPPATAAAFAALAAAAPSVLAAAGWPTAPASLAWLGFGAGVAYMLGELPNSFVKRWFGIDPGAEIGGTVGTAFRLVDQVDSIVGALLFLSFMVPFDAWAWATCLALGLPVHLAFNTLLTRLGLKPRLIPLARAHADCGGKAQGLAQLIAMGLPVPEGYVLKPQHFRNSLRELEKKLPQLGKEVIVRSSARGEDAKEASFAGILTSHRCPAETVAVARALESCIASLDSPRAREYQRVHGPLGGLAVIVQTYVPPMAAGVAFTRSPVALPFSGDPTEWMVIECVAGDNAKLVDGTVTPARVAFHPVQGIRALEGTLPLADATLRCVIDKLLVIAKDGPRDVEWVVDAHGEPWIVQSRPITTPTARPPVLWSNANIAENYPTPATPLQHSIVRDGYYHYFRRLALLIGLPRHRVEAMDGVLRDVVGLHGARLYFNLSNIYRLCAELPFASGMCSAFDQFMGVSQDVRADARFEARRAGAFLALKIGVLSMIAWWRLPGRVARFERCIDAYCGQRWPAVSEFLDIRFNQWWLISAGDLCTMTDSAIVRYLLKRWGQPELESDLLAGIPNLVSSRPGKEIWRLAALVRGGAALDSPSMRAQIDEFVERFGFRCSEELMITSPALDAPAVAKMVEAYVAANVEDPRQLEQRQRRVFERAWDKLGTLGPVRASVLRYFVRATRKAVALRERARFQQARLYKRFGAHLQSLGEALTARGVIDEPADVFFFEHAELEALVSEGRCVDVEARRAAFAAESAIAPPGHFVLPQGATYAAPREPRQRAGATGRDLSGTPASGGRVAGRAFVTHEVREIGASARIVVTSQTDPGWAPYMPMIKGLVVERGGLLSHGAIIAREYGIPAVIGVTHATDLIADGADVEVDGDLGLVSPRAGELAT